jgi:hypothetical protein
MLCLILLLYSISFTDKSRLVDLYVANLRSARGLEHHNNKQRRSLRIATTRQGAQLDGKVVEPPTPDDSATDCPARNVLTVYVPFYGSVPWNFPPARLLLMRFLSKNGFLNCFCSVSNLKNCISHC